MSSARFATDIKWATRQRLQYIEVKAWYTGVVSRSDLAQAFGISDAAATKDLKLYNDLAPGNLGYQHQVFGFVPTDGFEPVFAELSPARVLPVIAANLAVAGGPYGETPIYGLRTDRLPLPGRLPDRFVLAQLVRAICARRKLEIDYRSLSGSGRTNRRIIEPHALIDTGLRWHVRAYQCDSYDFRDFVLSRITHARMLDADAESDADYDDDWVEQVTLRLGPHPGLDDARQQNLLIDYGAEHGVIEVQVRRCLIGYLLQQLSVDTTADHSRNPNAFQLIVTNRDEVEPFAAWAFT